LRSDATTPNAAAIASRGPAKAASGAVEQQFAAIWMMHAGDDLDQCRFAGAVLAQSAWIELCRAVIETFSSAFTPERICRWRGLRGSVPRSGPPQGASTRISRNRLTPTAHKMKRAEHDLDQ